MQVTLFFEKFKDIFKFWAMVQVKLNTPYLVSYFDAELDFLKTILPFPIPVSSALYFIKEYVDKMTVTKVPISYVYLVPVSTLKFFQ